MLGCLISFMLGGVLGVAVMCLMFTAGETDRRLGIYDEEEVK